MTFDRALQIRRLVQWAPAQAIVMETDAPDIPPHWLYKTMQRREAGDSDMRNEPLHLPRIAQTVSERRGWSEDEAARVTSANAVDALPRLQLLGLPLPT